MTVVDLFERQARLRPTAVAVTDGRRHLGYEQLNSQSNRLAHRLRESGLGPESFAAVLLPRSLDLVIALLGVLKAGAAYVPLDPDHPPGRQAMLLEDCGAAAIVTYEHLREQVDVDGVEGVLLDRDHGAIGAQPATNPTPRALPENLAYLIYTSGSTGTPKPVGLRHSGLCNLLFAQLPVTGTTEHSRVLQYASPAFDASVWEIFPTLAAGAELVISSRDRSLDALADELAEVTVATLPPSVVASMSPPRASSLERLILAGEESPPGLIERWRGTVEIVNAYGPTEVTVCATAHRLEHSEGPRLPIGRPIHNVTVQIVDDDWEPVASGAVGELLVGGAGLARGYIGRPGLTAQRFVPDPSDPAGGRLYRTGDLARWREDGRLEFLGRVDDQVKVRGFRIELGEVEAAIGALDGVRQAVVLAPAEESGSRQLVAFVTLDAETTAPELRVTLSAKLPSYMVPSRFVVLESLPLNSNGKVEKRKLLDDERERSAAGADDLVLPRTDTERALAGPWREVLALPEGRSIGIDEDFVDLGGDSLRAMRFASLAGKALGLVLPVEQILRKRTLRDLAAALDAGELRGSSDSTVIARTECDGPLDLSSAQERLWFLNRLYPGSAAYNVVAAWSVHGPLDVEALARAATTLVERHEALRTSVGTSPEGRPFQLIHEPKPVHLVELTPGTETIADALVGAVMAPFDLERGRLVRFILVDAGGSDRVFAIVAHHIVCDGWSMDILATELGALYRALSAGRPLPLSGAPLQPADVAAWRCPGLEEEALGPQLAYWRQELAGLAPLELPGDRSRAPVAGSSGGDVVFTIDPAQVADLAEHARALGTTPFAVLLAAYQVLLSRHSGQEDLAVGVPVAGREHPELGGVVGFLVNTLVIRGDLAPNHTFSELVADISRRLLGALANQDVPFQRLASELDPDRDLSRTPLVQAAFGLHDGAVRKLDLGAETEVTAFTPELTASRFDLELNLTESSGGITGVLTYAGDKFDRATAERIAARFQEILTAVVANSDRRVGELSVLPLAERELITREWSGDAAELADESVLDLFERQVAAHPEAIAVSAQGAECSYRKLNADANRLANHLRALGVGAESLVGICLERSVQVVASVLGVLKAGAAYLPLDPDHPAKRLQAALADCEVRVLITTSAHLQQVGAPQLVLLDRDREAIARQPDTSPTVQIDPDALAYAIFTSGSTGGPKPVGVTRRGVHASTSARLAYYSAEPPRLLQLASIAFDSAAAGLFWVLCAGGELVQTQGLRAEGTDALFDLIGKRRATHLLCVPSAYRLLTESERGHELDSLHVVVLAGEAFDEELVRAHRQTAPGVELVDEYGPTEATIWATATKVRDGDSGTVIGAPIQNATTFVVDGEMEAVPIGVPGELLIGGVGVARGYLGRPAATAARFVPDPFGPAGGRLYRSGDLARWRPDARLEFLGRADDQVKVRGFRIELDEIESALRGLDTVSNAFVVAPLDKVGGRCLVAYLRSRAGTQWDPGDVRAALAERLPDFMVPSHFVAIDELPLTPNGKVDRRLLTQQADSAVAGSTEGQAPRTATEREIADLWREVLGLDAAAGLAVDRNFFDAGGDSLLLVRLHNRLQRKWGVRFPLTVLFAHPSISAQARLLDAGELDSAESHRAASSSAGLRRQMRDRRRHRRGGTGR